MSSGNLFTRDDTFFGVCEGIGQDIGVNPVLLRVGLTLFLFFQPVAALGVYAALGLTVLVSRLLFPVPRPAAAPEATTEPANENEQAPLPLAA